VTAVVGDRELAEEQVAEAFTRAWTSWGQVRRHAAPRAWVVRTALNLGVSRWRRRHREVPLADHDAAVPAGPGDGVDPALIAALRRLPARQREVLALRIFLDLDTETTAKVIGIAPGTVTAHLSRAVAALLSAVANCPEVAGLIDHPATFPYVWSTLGWNIHVHHSHLDVHPPVRVCMPFGSAGTRTAAGRTASSRPRRGRACR
jgi:DNA-directed RNA polymerase specialized sigma24 family protein